MSSPTAVLSALLTQAVDVADHNVEHHPRMLRVRHLTRLPDGALAAYLRNVTAELGVSAAQLLAALNEAQRRGWTMGTDGRVIQ
jgi:hypothetical protein